MLTLGGIGGILSGLLGFAWWYAIMSLFLFPSAEVALFVLSLLTYGFLLSGIFLIIHSIGFFGLGKKFGKGAATAAGVFALLYGIFMLGFGAMFLGALTAASPEMLMGSIGMLFLGLIFGFIFAILAIVGFSGTEKGTLGLVGGILTLIGLSPIGFLLMGICMIQQAKL